jgi:hypothetical protein
MQPSLSSAKKHKHQRSSSRKLFDSETDTQHETVVLVDACGAFDVQYYVDRANQMQADGVTVVETLGDESVVTSDNCQSAPLSYNAKVAQGTHRNSEYFLQNSPPAN